MNNNNTNDKTATIIVIDMMCNQYEYEVFYRNAFPRVWVTTESDEEGGLNLLDVDEL